MLGVPVGAGGAGDGGRGRSGRGGSGRDCSVDAFGAVPDLSGGAGDTSVAVVVAVGRTALDTGVIVEDIISLTMSTRPSKHMYLTPCQIVEIAGTLSKYSIILIIEANSKS